MASSSRSPRGASPLHDTPGPFDRKPRPAPCPDAPPPATMIPSVGPAGFLAHLAGAAAPRGPICRSNRTTTRHLRFATLGGRTVSHRRRVVAGLLALGLAAVIAMPGRAVGQE